MTDLFRVAILVSGSGTNMEALLAAGEKGGLPRATIALVISSRADAGALPRAQAHGVETLVIDPRQFSNDNAAGAALLRALEARRIDIICLAGYLKKLASSIISRYQGRILNIHPALLPKHGGPGMYGLRVHEAVLQAGDSESGCTVHVVDEEFDHGPILAQARVQVLKDDTPERLARRVLEQEHLLYPQVLKQFCEQLSSSPRAMR